MALRLRTIPPLRQAMMPRHTRLLASPLLVRTLHSTPRKQQAGLPPRGGGNPGQPLGSIFGQQKKPGETLAEAGIDLTKLAADGTPPYSSPDSEVELTHRSVGKLDPVVGRDAEIKRYGLCPYKSTVSMS